MAMGEKQPKILRLHHLDWLRSLMILAVVYCHSLQTLTHVPELRVDNMHFWPKDAEGNITIPEPPQSNYDFRWAAAARPVILPLLFYISGASLSFGNSLLPTFKKLFVITAAGMLVNFAILMVGPKDPACGFRDIPGMPRCASEGWLIDFMIAPYAGLIFPVLYQFWYTFFLMMFIIQDAFWYSTLRRLYETEPCKVAINDQESSDSDESEPTESDSLSLPSTIALLGVRWVAVSLWYVGLSFVGTAGGNKVPFYELVFLSIFEAIGMACLTLSAATRGVLTRMWQYAFILVVSFQFTVPNFQVTTFDGNTVLYFHLFRQFVALGYLSTLTRNETPPVISRVWPVMLILIVGITPSTNFYLAGIIPYPWFPRFFDRFLFLFGSFIIVLTLDRVGRSLTEAGEAQGAGCIPVPNFLGMGTLIMYVIHPVLIVLLVHLPVLESGDTGYISLAILFICMGGVGCWDLVHYLHLD